MAVFLFFLFFFLVVVAILFLSEANFLRKPPELVLLW